MEAEQTIINTKGKLWKHQLLRRIAYSKDFPTRLRLFNILRRSFGLDLLLFETPSGLKLLLDVNDWVQHQIYFFGSYEAQSLTLFKNLAKNASVVFDIGSHVGQYALECAQADADQTKKIYAIEVNPKTFTYLLNNLQMNKFRHVVPVLGAVAGTPGLLNIAIPEYWNMGNTQIAENNDGFNNYLAASFTVADLLEKYSLQHIDLVKIDVEGHEIYVLGSLFSAGIFPTDIILEFIPDVFAQCDDLVELLLKHNYSLSDVTGQPYVKGKALPEQNLWAHKI